MAKKKSATVVGDIERRKRADAKAQVRSLRRAHRKLSLELRKLGKGLASPTLIYHRD